VTSERRKGRRHAAVVLSTALMLAGCSQGSTRPGTNGSAPTAMCALRVDDARGLLGADAEVSSELPPIPGMPEPLERCRFENRDRQLQLTVFRGEETLRQLGVLINGATPEPRIARVAYCGGGRGTRFASFACVFLHQARTYVLSVNVVNSEDRASLHEDVRSLAASIVRREPAASAPN
jgi:hypothetical protein